MSFDIYIYIHVYVHSKKHRKVDSPLIIIATIYVFFETKIGADLRQEMLPTATRSRGAATGSRWRRRCDWLKPGQRLRFKQEELGFNHQTCEYFRNPVMFHV